MKKFLLFAGLAATALSFVGCNKEAEVRGLGKKTAELILTTVDTRTVNDGMNTKWDAKDTLTVFYAPAGTTNWSVNTPFTFSDADAGLAKGEVELTADAYDWYLFYPYTKQIPNPTGKDGDNWAGYFYVGSSSSGSQKQTGLNSMDHVAGKRVPLVGRVTAIPTEQTPEVSMKHLSTLLKINVTNVYENPVTINKISFTAPVDIVGSAYLDFSGAEPILVPSEGHIGKTAQLSVKDAEPLASGGTASFYLAVMPFSIASSDLLTVDITAEEGTCKAEMNATKAYSFEAGHIKTLNVEFEKAEPASSVSISEMLSMTDGEAVTSNEVLVVAKASTGVLVKEGSDYILVYDKSALADIKVGDKVVVKGTIGSYSGAKQITSPTVTVKSSNNTVTHPTAKDVTDSFETYSASYAEAVSFTGKLTVSGNYYNINVGEITSRIGSILPPAAEDADAIKALSGKNVKVTGYYLYIASKKYFYVIATEVKEVEGGGPEEGKITVPRINVSIYVDDTYDLQATSNSTASMTFVSDDSSIASVNSDGIVTGVAEGTTTITITLPEVPGSFTGDEKIINVTVNPKGGDAGGNWVATAASNLKDGDQFIYVATTANGTFAMSNDASGTKKQPVAITVHVSGDKLDSAPDNAIWTLEKSGDYFIFHSPNGSEDSWLYSTNDNNGLRVGTSETKYLYFDKDYLAVVDPAGNVRYIGVYVSNSDWRSYMLDKDGNIAKNIKDQTFTFFVKQ